MTDASDRRRAVEETGRSFLIEASAGTGKTTLLVSRILRLVTHDGVPLARIAALTFTEKAAAEMKTRLRERLEEEAADDREPASRQRAALALGDLPAAEVSTLHAFCARLLRERPVEAELDLDFFAPDESVTAELVEETVDGWIRREAAEPGSAMTAALRSGAQPAEIARLAASLVEQRLILATATLPDDPLAELRAELTAFAAELRGVLEATPTRDRSHPRARELGRLLASVDALAALPASALGSFRPEPLERGTRGPWRDEEVADLVGKLRERYEELPRRLAAFALEPVAVGLVRSIESSLFGAVEEEKRRRGLVDFDDLLLRTRDLLRRSQSVRETFRRRYERLLVDEFQDTDPVQAEIVLRLAAAEPQAVPDWSSLVPRPGALFLVGDPKQSIYRFRRADVETYHGVKERFAPDERLTLRSSFRAAPELLAYVNELGSSMMKEDPARPWEVGYAPLEAGRAHGDPGSVLHLSAPPPDDPENAGDVESEARAVAAIVASRRLSPRHGDVAVLVSRNRSLATFHEAFLDAGVPVALDGGISFYRREETAAVIATLRAVDDPGDSVSAVAALKSFLFAVDDLELLEAREAGARFDDLSATLPAGSPLRPGWELVERLHRTRHDRPAAETLLDLLTSRQALAALNAETARDPRQAVANLELLVAIVRELDREGLAFPSVVRRLTLRLEDERAEPRAFEGTEDAVRLLTVHRAKGLEFPVVVLADLAARPLRGGGEDSPFRCDRAGGSWAVRLRLGAHRVGTPGWARLDAADRTRREAEVKRLLYVALTRASRTLLVSWFRKRSRRKDGGISDDLPRSFLASLAWAARPRALATRTITVDAPPPASAGALRLVPPPLDSPPEAFANELARLDAWQGAVRRTSARPLRPAGGEVEDVAAPDRTTSPSSPAIAIGLAVHAAMEALLAPGEAGPPDLARVDDELKRLAAPLAPRERQEARQLVRRLVADPVTARAYAARRRFVEMPILFRETDADDAPVVEGKIDLLFEESPGHFVVVDWKTDRVDTPERLRERHERHLPQLEAYAAGLRRLLGAGARSVATCLVFARSPLPRAAPDSGAQLGLFDNVDPRSAGG